VVLWLAPEVAGYLGERINAFVPGNPGLKSAATWFDGHLSLGLMFLSFALFMVTRTVSRLT
jgi:hypothetical protein